MEEIRFNLFRNVHKGLRALLADTLILLQQTDFLIQTEANTAFERIKLVLLLMHQHTKWEVDFVFQKLGANALSMTGYFANQHYHADALTMNMDVLICGLEDAKSQTEKEAISYSLLDAFVEFTAYNFTHMTMEEQLINPLLWHTFSDQELQAMQMQHLNTANSQSQQAFLQWMLIHNSNRELANWLNSMNCSATAPQFRRVFDLAQEVLSPERLEFLNLNVYAREN
ncbi:hypothetical protein [Pedobacter deserti]|uniref:hypothetical protein n=1 Tax=Pedobacter deserti TaxID=2817382 RepID=UPI00210DE836|nr:hypothetical protein [Pedobacter sp. SYSU D00382]